MKGFRTMIFGALVAIAPAGLAYVGGIDWTQFGINPVLAAALGGAIMVLRSVTTTPAGNK